MNILEQLSAECFNEETKRAMDIKYGDAELVPMNIIKDHVSSFWLQYEAKANGPVHIKLKTLLQFIKANLLNVIFELYELRMAKLKSHANDQLQV